MWNKPSRQKLNSLPKLYSTEEIPVKEKLIQLHFFIGNTDFYICEYNGTDTFWGFVILIGDMEMAEFGYVNYEELESIKINGWQEIECDLHWKIRPANQVKKICIAQGWTLPDHSTGIECPNCKKLIRPGFEDNISCPECKVVILQRRINSVYQGGFNHGLYS
jgi:hypothetical protein